MSLGEAPVELIALADLCVVRCRSLDQVRALIQAGLAPEPAVRRPDGVELVAPDYLAVEPDPTPSGPALWQTHLERELDRFRESEQRLLASFVPERTRQREQQLMRMGSAAWGTALALCMQGRSGLARCWFDRAAISYRRSLADSEPGNWGRSIGALKSRVLAEDGFGSERESGFTLELGAEQSESTTARYAACLSLLVLGEDERAAALARLLCGEETFPRTASDSLMGVVTRDGTLYEQGIRALLESFETREGYLERIPVADTVLVIQSLARARGLAVELESHVLPQATVAVDE